MFKRLFQFYYETPGGTSAPGAGATPPVAEPAAQPTQPQSGAPDQGQGQGDGFRSTFFPNVPDEQWNIIAPHMENVNRHVTQLQQMVAPLRGYTPEAVQGLAQFAQQFDADPLGQWVQLARMLQQRGVVDAELDLDHLAALAAGEDPDAESATPPQIPGLDGLPPEVQQLVGTLQQQVQGLQQRLDQGDQQTQQRREDAALNAQLNWMRGELKNAQIDEALLTDQRLLAAFIAHRGNAQAAVRDLQDMRSGFLQGYVQQANPGKQRQQQQLDTSQRGVPKSGERPSNKGGRRGMFSGVSAGAEQYLRSLDKE